MKKILVLMATLASQTAFAQTTTTNCYSAVPGSVNCTTTAPPQIQVPPVNIFESVLRGQALAQQAQLAAAQRRNLELQNEALKRQLERDQPPTQPGETELESDLRKFAVRAAERKHWYPDFDTVVGNSELKITPMMVSIFADRPYAADIAYYLGKHPAETEAISRMNIQEASWAILDIEAKVVAR